MKKKFKTLLKEYRKEKGITQVEFALLVGAGNRTVQYWEAGRNVDPKTIAGDKAIKLLGEWDKGNAKDAKRTDKKQS